MVVSALSCQDYGHVAAQYPFRNNLKIEEADDDEIETVAYEPTGSATDSDDDVRISIIQLGVVRITHNC